jgi:hypothetical protein
LVPQARPSGRDLDPDRRAILVHHGKANKRRELGMDERGWELLRPWLAKGVQMPAARSSASSTDAPVGGRSRRRAPATICGAPLRRPVSDAGSRRTRCAAHAVEMALQGVPLTSSSANSDTQTRDSVRLHFPAL